MAAKRLTRRKPIAKRYDPRKASSAGADMHMPVTEERRVTLSIEEYGRRILKAVTQGKQKVNSISRYEFLKEIGEGPQGAVFIAEQVSACGIKKPVAIKVLREDQSDSALNRFVEEAMMLSELSQGTAVELLALEKMEIELPPSGSRQTMGGKKQLYFMVQELVSGPSLEKLQKLHARNTFLMHPAVVGYIINRTALALDEAHNLKSTEGKSLRLIHRSLSPSNILINEKAGLIKLSDFGMSVLMDSGDGGKSKKLKGKVKYMAPEQFSDKSTPKSDIWSLGVIAYEAITGVCPYKPSGKTVDEVVNSWKQQLDRSLRAPADIRILKDESRFSFSSLSDIIMKCLQPNQDDRPTAHQLSRMLEEDYLYKDGLGPTGRTMAAYISLLSQATGDSKGEHPDVFAQSPAGETLLHTLGLEDPWRAIERRTENRFNSEFVAAVRAKDPSPCLIG